MNIEIWSDVMCPFCYLGKKNLEEALKLTNKGEDVNIEWKSFQLNPNLGDDPISTYDYLAQMRGLNVNEIKGSFANIVASGKEKGIDFNFDTALVVNTAAAHRFIQLAKEKGKGDEAEEALFKAQFSDGKNVSSPEVLNEVGLSLGLSTEEIADAQINPKYQSSFEKDVYESRQIGVRGVPFFVFDRKYALSGAQPVELFAETLEKSFNEWKLSKLEVIEGDACDIDGNCN